MTPEEIDKWINALDAEMQRDDLGSGLFKKALIVGAQAKRCTEETKRADKAEANYSTISADLFNMFDDLTEAAA